MFVLDLLYSPPDDLRSAMKGLLLVVGSICRETHDLGEFHELPDAALTNVGQTGQFLSPATKQPRILRGV